ncbi:hypothetical protein PInf_015280 [Phytophthora infestans]|nr:hypothetical protein PInf_015280 [Phytophthora infestans]
MLLRRSVIPIVIEERNTVVDFLKDAIKQKNPNTIQYDAKDLQLFLAKTAGDKWLVFDSDDVEKLKKGGMTATVKVLTSEEKELQRESDVLTGEDDWRVKLR